MPWASIPCFLASWHWNLSGMEKCILPSPQSLYFISLSPGTSFRKMIFFALDRPSLCCRLIYSHLPLHPSVIAGTQSGATRRAFISLFKSWKSQPTDPITIPGWEPLALSHLPIVWVEKLWFREGHFTHPSAFTEHLFYAKNEDPRWVGASAGCVSFWCCWNKWPQV